MKREYKADEDEWWDEEKARRLKTRRVVPDRTGERGEQPKRRPRRRVGKES
jgi:hypothetical protein